MRHHRLQATTLTLFLLLVLGVRAGSDPRHDTALGRSVASGQSPQGVGRLRLQDYPERIYHA